MQQLPGNDNFPIGGAVEEALYSTHVLDNASATHDTNVHTASHQPNFERATDKIGYYVTENYWAPGPAIWIMIAVSMILWAVIAGLVYLAFH